MPVTFREKCRERILKVYCLNAGAVADGARCRRAPVLGAQRPLDEAQVATLPGATLRRLAIAQQHIRLRALLSLLDAFARGERRRRRAHIAAAPLQTAAVARHGQGDRALVSSYPRFKRSYISYLRNSPALTRSFTPRAVSTTATLL